MAVRLTRAAIAKAIENVAAIERRKDLTDAGCLGFLLLLTSRGSESRVVGVPRPGGAKLATFQPRPPWAGAAAL
jgi:hypothetical protein